MSHFFEQELSKLKGVTPQRLPLLQNELRLFTFADLIQYYPFRYEDRTHFHKIREIHEGMEHAQFIGRIRSYEKIGVGHKQRLVAEVSDESGRIELVWFKGIQWIEKTIKPGLEFIFYGKPTFFNGNLQMTHPEMELFKSQEQTEKSFQPIYSLTEKLRKKYIDSKVIAGLQKNLLAISFPYIRETLSEEIIQRFKLISKQEALYQIHLPASEAWLHQAKRRLKFEELFYNQLRLVKHNLIRKNSYPGQIFSSAALLKNFYHEHLPFELTDAQKKVIREIFNDMKSGQQMNRLLQGDVGSGKTIVAFICMLLAIDNKAQACIIAPTEILADQHFKGLSVFAEAMGITIAKLTGSTKKKDRIELFENLANGKLQILVGTHAILEDPVVFKNLGLCIIDEQHRFGVAQRAKLWEKNQNIHPHILVMTATPIPRTLAMTLYGDLDISVIDQLPAGRKPIQTIHRFDAHRLQVFGFMQREIEKGRQIYVVYPLIEESEKMDLKDLMDGYESISRAFPNQHLSILHGKMKPADKDFEMARFLKQETQIMVATTVIEVGVNVPNASVMVIENAERFGLSQLHQLRGRVGRGADQSYCILMTKYELGVDTKKRIETMVKTNNGFEIAEVDLELRGPGDMSGTRQSGAVDMMIADLAKDSEILKFARETAIEILTADPELKEEKNQVIRQQIALQRKDQTNWAQIS
ncbi:ATP-dependent DNA helicase RecG [Sandaracinomonas limnophila]|uniref:ATP-dependent DNA helicase RecG n=1 Tax=Sandaracinomonas limnophila TaxID=1862386 RepID=A0A437PS44_9BACT|nr:ATP-dependent DNA helicase RecG [Sandaracinomonas limnophila]RVU25050.1 ATP-dependent DNA helicase RecG [Sandaracinomonas limnophila]